MNKIASYCMLLLLCMGAASPVAGYQNLIAFMERTRDLAWDNAGIHSFAKIHDVFEQNPAMNCEDLKTNLILRAHRKFTQTVISSEYGIEFLQLLLNHGLAIEKILEIIHKTKSFQRAHSEGHLENVLEFLNNNGLQHQEIIAGALAEYGYNWVTPSMLFRRTVLPALASFLYFNLGGS